MSAPDTDTLSLCPPEEIDAAIAALDYALRCRREAEAANKTWCIARAKSVAADARYAEACRALRHLPPELRSRLNVPA